MLNPKIKYTNVDHIEIFQELMRRQPLLTDKWTDKNVSDIGVTLVDLYAGVAALLLFYLDKKAQDLYLPTCRTSEAIYSLAKLVGYQIKGRIASRTTLRFSTVEEDVTVIIPKYTVCTAYSGDSSGNYVTVEPGLISPGEYYTEVEAWQGSLGSQIFESTGLALQKCTILGSMGQNGEMENPKIAHGSWNVTVDGVLYSEVQDFSQSTETDGHYVVQTNYDKSISFVFGDGFNGIIPANEAQIVIQYIVTEGEDGNRGQGMVTSVNSPIYDSLGNRVSVTVTNTAESSGGKNEETLFRAKKMIPSMVRTHNRAVTEEDFTYWAENFPGILQARVVDINDYPMNEIEIDYYQIRIVVIPESGDYVSQRTKEALYQDLTSNHGKYVTADIDVVDPEYVDITVTLQALYDSSYTMDDVRLRVNDFITNYFKPSETPLQERRLTGSLDGQYIGENVDYISLISGIHDIAGILAINALTLQCSKGTFGLGQERQTVPIARYEMPRISNIILGLTPNE